MRQVVKRRQTLERSSPMAGTARGRPEPLPFEAFFRDTYGRLVGALLTLTGDRSQAEEIAQEALARAFERWDRVSVMASAEGYVFRTALNLQRTWWRRSMVRRRLLPPTAVDVDPIAATEWRQDLSRAMGSLSHGQRAALLLVEWFGLKTEEAAAVLGVRPATLRVRLHRARSTLRERLGGRDE
jgi:RNA polymerase sigma factor (sigma-70 family)